MSGEAARRRLSDLWRQGAGSPSPSSTRPPKRRALELHLMTSPYRPHPSVFDCLASVLLGRGGYWFSIPGHMSELPLIRPSEARRPSSTRLPPGAEDSVVAEAPPHSDTCGGRKGGINDMA